MIQRASHAEWHGSLKEGHGKMKVGNGAYEGPFSFASRFENGTGTNPEELIAAAHAGCYSMALSAGLGKAGYNPNWVRTQACVTLDKVGEGFTITKIELETEADVPGIDEATFQKYAEETKKGCPVSKLLTGAEITLKAKLVSGVKK
jgi:osmotically inducible protein OsmC